MPFEFNFSGGSQTMSGATAKFLLFLVNGGREVPFWEATKIGLASHAEARNMQQYDPTRWTTDCNVVKLFIKESEFGKEQFWYSFYMLLGRRSEGQVVEIRPRLALAKARGYMFKAEAKFLKPSEASALFEESSMPWKMIQAQTRNPPPVEVFRDIITITRARAAVQQSAVRRLRV